MSSTRQIRSTARRLLKLSLVDGQLSESKVQEVLAWFDQHRPSRTTAILREYHRLVVHEIGRSRAVVEYAGPLPAAGIAAIVAGLAKNYGRPVASSTRENPALIAGVRVSIGDEVYERSIASQLDVHASATA